MWLWIWAACTPDPGAPIADAVPAVEDTGPRCGGFGEACAALPPRPDALSCGATLDRSAPDAVVWPERLSALACFESLVPVVPSAGVIPYEVNSPLWTEGAYKQRFFAIPPGLTIRPDRDLAWEIPVGGLLLKAFSIDLVTAGVAARRPAEVRVMARTEQGWAYAGYGWDEAVGDGVLIPPRGELRTLSVQHNGRPTPHGWYYPGVDGCRNCHRDLADEVLGPHTNQLHREVDYGAVRADQLVAMDAIGLFDPSPAGFGELPALPDPMDDAADLASRARSWLHANCAHCHQPGGFAPPDMKLDLRYDTPFEDTFACGVPRQTGLYTGGDYVIDPGNPDGSAVIARMSTSSPEKMPPDGATWPDAAGIALVRSWITSLRGCP